MSAPLRFRVVLAGEIVGYEEFSAGRWRFTSHTGPAQRWYLGVFENNEMERWQSAGLTDKNGKEIYEGDLVVDYAGRMEKGQEDWVWTVIFENGMTNAVVETQGKRVSTITPNGILHSESLEVVGNIHENPELLK